MNRPGDVPGVRTEIKNINSIRFVKNAIGMLNDKRNKVENGAGVGGLQTNASNILLKEVRPTFMPKGYFTEKLNSPLVAY